MIAEGRWSPESLFADYYPAITRAATLVTGDMESARDCVQEAFLRVWRDWEQADQVGHKELWVRQVVLNLARERWRATRRRLVLLGRTRALPLNPPSPEGDTRLWSAVRLLRTRQRIALGFYYLGGFSISEVSAAMGISDGAAERYLNRARTRPAQEDGGAMKTDGRDFVFRQPLKRLLKNGVSPSERNGHVQDKDALSTKATPSCGEDDVLRRSVRSGGRDFVLRQPLRTQLDRLVPFVSVEDDWSRVSEMPLPATTGGYPET
jgi:RNA polymerase sigma factor (sigma-70 family)